MGNGVERESGERFGTVADNLAERAIDTDETPIERHQCHTNGRLVERESKSLLRFLQRSLDAFALADIARECLPATVGQDL